MTQYTKVLLLGGAAIFINLLICAIVAGYILISLRSRSATGLFWRFSRDRQPILFWLQLALVSSIILYMLREIYYVVRVLIVAS